MARIYNMIGRRIDTPTYRSVEQERSILSLLKDNPKGIPVQDLAKNLFPCSARLSYNQYAIMNQAIDHLLYGDKIVIVRYPYPEDFNWYRLKKPINQVTIEEE